MSHCTEATKNLRYKGSPYLDFYGPTGIIPVLPHL